MNKYILLEIYFLDTRNSRDIRTKIIRKAYLVDSLKIKIFIRTNIIRSKKINIIILKN